jgi:hypothetical protein
MKLIIYKTFEIFSKHRKKNLSYLRSSIVQEIYCVPVKYDNFKLVKQELKTYNIPEFKDNDIIYR